MTRPVSMLRFLSLLSLLLPLLLSRSLADSHFEGFEAGEDEDVIQQPHSFKLPDLPLSQSHSHSDDPDPDPTPNSDPLRPSTSAGFDFWDEDEFEGIPPPRTPIITESESAPSSEKTDAVDGGETAGETPSKKSKKKDSFLVEIACVSYLIIFAINYFTGKKENENIALSWASKFATKDSIFDKNFSLLGVGEGEDSPLLLKEGLSVFKFYASGRRYCQGVVATMELKSRHDLMARLYNMVVPCKDEINFEVQMNDDAMDHVVFAMAKKKLAKSLHKEVVDLQRFAGVMTPAPTGRKWVAEELGIVTESKEVAGDLITETMLDQVFGEKAFENHGKGFISMHFSDQYCGRQKKVLFFKFALPDVNKMAEMTRLVALIPYYIDLIGRYKLSPQARSKAGTARLKLAQEIYREHQNARQEELQKKKADKKRQAEEANAKLSAEALRKKEAKERARQVKKAMPKIKMSRGH